MSGEMPVHRLTVNAKGVAGRELSFYCYGAPDSECHIYPDCGCESWAAGNHAHPFVPHEECWMAAWFSNGVAVYEGPDADDMEEGSIPASWAVRSGRIKVSFKQDYLGWEWDHSALVRTEDKAALLVRYACSCGETMGLITDEALVAAPRGEGPRVMLRLMAAHKNHQAQEEGK